MVHVQLTVVYVWCICGACAAYNSVCVVHVQLTVVCEGCMCGACAAYSSVCE